ncbi:MAG: M20/M25/M40 family metallo-hydrolase [Clostridia bacterium]|nr:M20/M25/M40 family metallo-hydrolase [Clostridia bacterium]
MSYVTSDKVKSIINAITEMEEVKNGLEFIKNEEDLQIKQQCELVMIEAPTGDELDRANWMVKQFEALGLTDCHVDEYKNAIGVRKGTGNGKKIVVEGHMDTVFPRGSVKEVKIENGIIHCPGIGDDTRGCIAVLGVIRVLNAMNIQTEGDIIFMGTAREEGMGGLGGIRDFMSYNPDIDGYINIDGGGVGGIVYQATGMKTCEANFYGKGGHAMGAFGKVANPLNAAARAVAKIANLQVPEDPKTIFCVSNFHAGNDAGIHAIVQKATIKYNIRSNSQEELNKLDRKILAILAEACFEETARWGMDTITFDQKYYVDVPAGTLDEHNPIVEADYETIKYLGFEPEFMKGGATNANMPIGAGVPAVCLGMGRSDFDGKVHTLDEQFRIEGAYKGIQHAFLMTLACAGISGKTESVL